VTTFQIIDGEPGEQGKWQELYRYILNMPFNTWKGLEFDDVRVGNIARNLLRQYLKFHHLKNYKLTFRKINDKKAILWIYRRTIPEE